MNLLPGVRSHTIATNRLRMHYIEAGPEDGIPVVLIHGNLATGRFYEHLFPGAPDRYRLIAPDMRGFGDTERVPIDATRGLRDWADDTHSLVQALGIDRPVHLANQKFRRRKSLCRYQGHSEEGTDGDFGPITPRGAREQWHSTSRYRYPKLNRDR